MRATYIRAGCCESARSGGKEIAKNSKIMFDGFVNKTGWKLILSQNVGKFLDVVVKAIQVLLILNVLSTSVRINPNL